MAAILLCFRTQVVPVGTNAAQNLERLTFPFTKKEDPVILIQERDLLRGLVDKQDNHALLQGLTLISGTQTRCRRLDSYIEQKKFLAFGPEFSVEFSAPPEFSGGVTEKYLSTGWVRTFALQITKQILYHCATAPLYL
jgi:hypothetical protein